MREIRERNARGECFICEIARDVDSPEHHVVYRDDRHIAFFNRYPTLRGYTLVAPVEHRDGVVADFSHDEYLELQSLIHRIGRAISAAVPTERLYILSLGAKEGNDHVHWHLAPLPPGVPLEEQQLFALMPDRTGYLDMPAEEKAALARAIAANIAEP